MLNNDSSLEIIRVRVEESRIKNLGQGPRLGSFWTTVNNSYCFILILSLNKGQRHCVLCAQPYLGLVPALVRPFFHISFSTRFL